MKKKTSKVIHFDGPPPFYLIQRCQRYLETAVIPEAMKNGENLVYAISKELARRQQYIEELSKSRG